ncbi:MAG: Hdr-like menaquinol oxidoreductase cytochrome c subunit [Magnetococcales bacterium]|nr:Hdr-like menaquinol oxidoreductase cytochrome c subunit [Magnetococcales bacterium]
MVWFRTVGRVAAVLLGLWLMVGVPGPATAGDGAHAGHDHGKLDAPKGEACIKDAAWMKRNHMDFLKHRRAETVREGVRNHKESLLNCKTCHTSREKFCDRCHAYVGVKPDCFTCHIYP